jgi:hypothetical protein
VPQDQPSHQFQTVVGEAAAQAPPAARLWSALAAADSAAVRFSALPGEVLAWLLAANIVLGAAGVALGQALRDDAALYYRELMPGTLLSAGHILAAALVARAIHRRDRRGRSWYESFWGLSAVLLAVLVFVELAQPTIFLSKWVQKDLGLRAPAGIADVDGLLVAFLLTAVVAILAARALDVFRYPRAVAVFAGAVLLAATSQFIDATSRVSEWEFVIEDGAKALAGPFLLAGYLVVLGTVVKERRTR